METPAPAKTTGVPSRKAAKRGSGKSISAIFIGISGAGPDRLSLRWLDRVRSGWVGTRNLLMSNGGWPRGILSRSPPSRAKGHSVLSRRKPRALAREPASLPWRFGARQFLALLFRLPPRYTRAQYEQGPCGSVTEPPG